MRTLFIITFFTFLSLSNFAQDSSTIAYNKLTKLFLTDIYKNHFAEGKIVVAKKLDPFTIKQILDVINEPTLNRSIVFKGSRNKNVLIRLSLQEKMFIRYQLHVQDCSWLTNNYKNVDISTDTILRNNLSTLYYYSRPIFIRNNNLCLFYSGSHCGSLCGGGLLALYKKINGKWKMYWTIFSYIS